MNDNNLEELFQGPEVRGSKPILVCFEKYTDKDDILRKASKLRGTNIYVGEDFSKRVKDQRHELQKFLKAVKRKRPNSTFKMQYDKVNYIRQMSIVSGVIYFLMMHKQLSIYTWYHIHIIVDRRQ